LFYEGAKGRYWSQISHRKLKISISHGMVIWAEEPDPVCEVILQNRKQTQIVHKIDIQTNE
jgi:tRNA-binding EMAP/Myf-like protein